MELKCPEGDVIVRPVPEHRADEQLSAVYRDFKATLGVPWVGVVVQASAYYRRFFLEAWRQFRPAAGSDFFHKASDDLRLGRDRLVIRSAIAAACPRGGRLCAPGNHPDAMARWPSYLKQAWESLKPRLDDAAYAQARQRLHTRTVELIQWLLSGLMLNVSYFKLSLQKSECIISAIP